MKKVLITESQLRGMVRKMLIEQTAMSTGIGQAKFVQPQAASQTGQQKDQAIETAMLTALQKNTTLLTNLKSVRNFSQVDKLIQTVLGFTSIPSQQIKSGLVNLSRIGVQTQAGR